MRKLTKLPLPDDLSVQLTQWERELVRLLGTGESLPQALKDRYRYPSLKRQIIQETFGNCAYCESKIEQVYPGDVEHILPKQRRPELRLNYQNLTLACWRCNHEKLSYYDVTLPLLNPYDDDPDEFLIAYGPLILHVPGNRRGEATWRQLKLDRKELIDRRTDRLKKLQPLVDRYIEQPVGLLKSLLEEELKKESEGEAEYTFVVRAYLQRACGIGV